MDPWEKPVPFTPDFKIESGVATTFSGFQEWADKELPHLTDLPVIKTSAQKTVQENARHICEQLYIYRRWLPMRGDQRWGGFLSAMVRKNARYSLDLAQGRKRGTAYFDSDVELIVMSDFRWADYEVVMSLTPMEVITLRPGLRKARGNVMIAGLGLGWFTRQVLLRKQVKHVTVVELHQGVIDLSKEWLESEFGDRVTCAQGNAYEQDYEQYDSVLFDVWNGYGNARYHRRWHEIKREVEARGARAWAWGDVDIG